MAAAKTLIIELSELIFPRTHMSEGISCQADNQMCPLAIAEPT